MSVFLNLLLILTLSSKGSDPIESKPRLNYRHLEQNTACKSKSGWKDDKCERKCHSDKFMRNKCHKKCVSKCSSGCKCNTTNPPVATEAPAATQPPPTVTETPVATNPPPAATEAPAPIDPPIASCTDSHSICSGYKSWCGKGATMGGEPLDDFCCATCNDLTDPPTNKPTAAPFAELTPLTDLNMKAILDRHNLYRCMHGVPLLQWNSNIAINAQKWAEATGGKMKHSSNSSRKDVAGFPYLGENLAWGTYNSIEGPVDAWYNEIDFTNPRGIETKFPPKDTGHYTQVVWKETTDLGCSKFDKLVVCQYGKGGNMFGQFQDNVLAPTKTSADCGNSEEEQEKKSIISI